MESTSDNTETSEVPKEIVDVEISAEERAAYEKREVLAEWHVPLRGKIHKIEFEHGTTSGRRVLWVDRRVNILVQILLLFFCYH